MNCDLRPKLDVSEIANARQRLYCFVCTGNTCRSPMAEAYFNQFAAAHGMRAVSAGIYANAGDRITNNAVAALEAAGIKATPENDYPRHIARNITRGIIENCDEVICISNHHMQDLLRFFPDFASKITALGDISDPFGKNLEAYKECLKIISDRLKEKFPSVFPEEM